MGSLKEIFLATSPIGGQARLISGPAKGQKTRLKEERQKLESKLRENNIGMSISFGVVTKNNPSGYGKRTRQGRK